MHEYLAHHYDKEVPANVKWYDTGIDLGPPLDGGVGARIHFFDKGETTWTANPSRGPYSAAGDPGHIVSGPGNPAPGEFEGALIGKIGEQGTPFLIGSQSDLLTNGSTPSGRLLLIINDELNPQPNTGAGFGDNEGSIALSIDIYLPFEP